MNRKPEVVLEVIEEIYSAACDPRQWSTVAERIQHLIGGHSVNLVLEDTSNPNFQHVFTNGMTADDVQIYQRKYIKNDEFTGLIDGMQQGSTLLSQAVWDERQLHLCYPYEEFYERLGYTYFNVSLFYCDEQKHKRGWLSIARSANDERFTVEESSLLKTLTPHLQRAFLIHSQLIESQLQQSMCLDSLELISMGVIFFGANGQFVHCNSLANKYLRAINNLKQNYRVQLPDHQANTVLQTTISETLYSNASPQRYLIPFVDGETHKVAMCLPWRMNEESKSWFKTPVACVVFILTSADDIPNAERLSMMFKISIAESRVLHEMMNGMSAQKISESLLLSEATIRFHIKSLLRKFESANQIQLLSKVFKMLMCKVK